MATRDPKEPGILEKDVEAYFRDQVKKKLKGKSFKFRSPQNRGVTDRVAVLPGGEVWFIELKKVGGVMSELQKLHAEDLIALGAYHACLVGKTGVDEWLEARQMPLTLQIAQANKNVDDDISKAAAKFKADMAARPKGAR